MGTNCNSTVNGPLAVLLNRAKKVTSWLNIFTTRSTFAYLCYQMLVLRFSIFLMKTGLLLPDIPFLSVVLFLNFFVFLQLLVECAHRRSKEARARAFLTRINLNSIVTSLETIQRKRRQTRGHNSSFRFKADCTTEKRGKNQILG